MIREVTGDAFPVDPAKGKKSPPPPKPSTVPPKDKVELSAEAKALYESGENQRIDEIRRKIQDGFYRRHDVMDSIVNALLEDLKKEAIQ